MTILFSISGWSVIWYTIGVALLSSGITIGVLHNNKKQANDVNTVIDKAKEIKL